MARKIGLASVTDSPYLRKRVFSPALFRTFILLTVLLTISVFNWPYGPSSAANLPSGFTESLVAGGMTNPTALAIAPDGRIFVCQQGGALRVIQNGSLLATPFVTISVNSTGERGLLGVAFDPNFAANNFVYVYYTTSSSPIHNRVSRFTANGNVAAAGSETVLLDLNNLTSATNHNGGALHFGPDGKLYVAVGENATASNSQTLGNLLGKILRINTDPANLIPADNPFFDQTTGNNRAIWALGLRNPYTFNFQPGTGRMFINDVGQSTTEEINDGIGGSNYGWPNCEGPCNPPNASFRDPVHWYANDASTCAITGGTFYNPATVQFPAAYVGKYFFADFCGGWIKTFNPANSNVENFATAASSPVDLQVGGDGSLYYLQRGAGGQLWQIQYTANQPPAIMQNPASQTVIVGQSATFNVSASGTVPLSYQWRRNNMDIQGANSPSYTLNSATLADNGAQFSCFVSNNFGNATSSAATLTVLQNPPPATLAKKADFDGDGRTDLSVWRGLSRNWLVIRSMSGSLQTTAWGDQGSPYNDLAVPGDYDGDGKTDHAVFRRQDGAWYVLKSSNGSFQIQAWGTATDIPVQADYDGDNKTDFAFWRPSEGNWYILKSSNGQTQITNWGVGLAPYNDVPVPGDYDGDGKTDIAVFRRQTGFWYVLKSSNGTFIAQAWGVATDTPVAGDYDGDGKYDLAVWRPSEGNWYILKSMTGQFQITNWGAGFAPHNDIPVPGDYDGDNKTDIAVWRPSSGNWYVIRSSNSSILIQLHGQNGDTPVPSKLF